MDPSLSRRIPLSSRRSDASPSLSSPDLSPPSPSPSLGGEYFGDLDKIPRDPTCSKFPPPHSLSGTFCTAGAP